MIDANTFSIAASFATIILAILAIVLSIWFFVLAKKTETQTSSSLTKIETQADSLQKLTGRWMDRFTKYATSDRPIIVDESFPQLLAIISYPLYCSVFLHGSHKLLGTVLLPKGF